MKKLLVGFNRYITERAIFEAAGDTPKQCIIAASNAAEKAGQERFITEVSMMDPQKLDELLNSIQAKGAGIISKLDATFAKRAEAGLDTGELRKEGEWYRGKGAWRVNSAKADHIGLTPDFIDYYDPKQQEILEKYFPEDFGKSGVTVGPSGELKGFEAEPTKAPVKAELKGELVPSEEELVTSESLKHLKKMFEADDEFTLGPPAAAKNAVVVDTKELVDQLVDNYLLDTRDNVMIWGAPGIGKTEVVKGAAKRISAKIGKEVPVLVVTLATKAAYDIAGIPILFTTEASTATVYGKEKRGQIGMDFAYPAWLPSKDDSEEGILFFDEINRADVDVMGAALTLLLDRKSGSYEIPDGWRVWAAGNRDMDGPVKPFEGAMASRFLGGHWHLVPTVDSWSDWARSNGAYFKGTTEWYVPTEFLSFLKLKDVVGVSKEGETGTISNLGRKYRVKFEYFYNWDAAAAASTGGGKMEGFPTPRTWTKAFSNIYQKLRADSDLMSKVSPSIDPQEKVISVFGIALLDPKMEKDILMKMSAIVGIEATDAFLQFAKQMARLNDAEGTLIEKVENVFSNPAKPRPLLNIDKLGADEIFGVLNAVEGRADSLVTEGKFKTDELVNWMKYIIDLENSKKASKGEITQHVATVISKHALAIKPLTAKTNPDITPEHVKILAEFQQRWKQFGEQLRNL